jgi:hypothetical protein
MNSSSRLITATAALLFAITVVLPIAHWIFLADLIWSKLLAGITALALGIGKLAFVAIAWYQLRHRRIFPALFLFCFGSVLWAISIDASRDLLEQYIDITHHIPLQQPEPALLLSLALHLCCIMALLASSVWRPEESETLPDYREPQRAKAVNNTVMAVKAQALNNAQINLAKRISRGEFGRKPSIDLISQKNLLQGGEKDIEAVFAFLRRKNVLKRIGHRDYLILFSDQR